MVVSRKRSMPILVGHRGAGNLLPENGISSFRKALELGVDAVEFDVHRSKDGELFVIHDPFLDRTTTGKGAISQLTSAEIKAVTLEDSGGETVPTLREALAVLGPSDVELHLELKTDAACNPYLGLERQVTDMVARAGLNERTIFTCFVPGILETVLKQRSDARVLASLNRGSAEAMGGIEAAVKRFAEIPNCYLAVERTLLRHTQAQVLKHFGWDRIGVWIVNSAGDFRQWAKRGVRQITTNRPDTGMDALNKRAE